MTRCADATSALTPEEWGAPAFRPLPHRTERLSAVAACQRGGASRGRQASALRQRAVQHGCAARHDCGIQSPDGAAYAARVRPDNGIQHAAARRLPHR